MPLRKRKSQVPDFTKFTKNFTEHARAVTQREVDKFANTSKDAFVEYIRAQKFDAFKAFPLSWVTLALRRRHGIRGQLTMIATGHYIDSIAVHHEAGKKKGVARTIIGIDPSIHAKDRNGDVRSDVTLQSVARIQEYGAPRASIPARPHWTPYLSEMTKKARHLRKDIARLVRSSWAAKMRTKKR